ncbi:GntR family transcriptional regulator [Flavobacteriaceae bacterium 3-367]
MELIKGKQADIVQHCIYEIATGKWPSGLKLPSVREAEKLWGVNRHTVLGAYRELEKIGLVASKDRSGYYVREDAAHEVGDTGLNQLYSKVKALIGKHSNFDLSYTFRYFNNMAISEARTSPAYAFLECTQQQAEDHAGEIYQKLNAYVLPVRIADIEVGAFQIPESVRTLLTTGFHIKQVQELGKHLNKEVVNIPIEVDPDLLLKYQKRSDSGVALVVELEGNMSSNIAKDVQRLARHMEIQQKLVSDVASEIPKMLHDPDTELILVSPRVWGKCPTAIKKHRQVKLIRFRVSHSSWKIVSRALKIPF